MKFLLFFVILCIFCMMALSNGGNENDLIIFDTDSGTDDAWALILLLNGEKIKNYKLIAVTCVSGNTSPDHTANNVLRILNAMGRQNIPVFKGSYKPIIAHDSQDNKNLGLIMGKDGFGDVFVNETIDDTQLQTNHAVTAMYELVLKYPKQITFFLLGPLTNFALCLTLYGNKFIDNVKEVHLMGGNIRGVGNSGPSAEFNFFFDPEAANIVLSRTSCPIIQVPWEACIPDNLSIKSSWRLESLKNTEKDEIKILNKAEEVIWKNRPIWKPCDLLSVAAYIFPNEIIDRKSKWNATVELCGKCTRGQMILDHQNRSKIKNIEIIEKINENFLKDLILWLAGEKQLNIQ